MGSCSQAGLRKHGKMLSQCWLSCHSIFPSQGCSQLAVSTQRRQEAPGDQDCIKTDMASSCWWSVPLACNTSWNIPDTWTQKKKKGTVFYCTTFAKGIISVSEGWGQVFFFLPPQESFPQLNTWLSTCGEQGTVPDISSLSTALLRESKFMKMENHTSQKAAIKFK